MKKETGIIINGNEFNSLLDGSIKIKPLKKYGAIRYMRSVCDIGCRVFITAIDKKGTKWKFSIKRQTFEKLQTADDVFKYIAKLKKQRLKRQAYDNLEQNDLIKTKCEYFDDLVEKIRTEHIRRLNDYNAIQEFFGYKDFNVLLGGNLYHYKYEIDVDSSPLSLTFDQENKYGIDKSGKMGIYYKGVFVKGL